MGDQILAAERILALGKSRLELAQKRRIRDRMSFADIPLRRLLVVRCTPVRVVAARRVCPPM